MKKRRQEQHDPNFNVRKYDRYGNVKQEWKMAYEKKKKSIKRKKI